MTNMQNTQQPHSRRRSAEPLWYGPDVPKREPVFNVPMVVIALIAVLVLVHTVRMLVLDTDSMLFVTYITAFHPWIFSAPDSELYLPAMRYWTPVSYAFLHGDLAHLAINCGYLLAFGTPVARRFGAARFCTLLLLGALGGSAAHWVTNVGSHVPMIGASAAISAAMGAAVRFAFSPDMPIAATIHRPAQSLRESMTNRSVVVFLVVWFGLNWVLGSGVLPSAAGESTIAWQAHIGGFLVGWLGFRLLDPVEN